MLSPCIINITQFCALKDWLWTREPAATHMQQPSLSSRIVFSHTKNKNSWGTSIFRCFFFPLQLELSKLIRLINEAIVHFSVYVGITSLRVQNLFISPSKWPNAAFKSSWDAHTHKCISRYYDVMGVQVILVIIKLTD